MSFHIENDVLCTLYSDVVPVQHFLQHAKNLQVSFHIENDLLCARAGMWFRFCN